MSSRIAQLVRQVAIALGAFAIGAYLIRGLIPNAPGTLAWKLEYYLDHQDEFDAVFIGSSRVYRGVNPKVFDAAFAEADVPVRSFNLGIGGMRTFESDYLLHRVLDAKPAKLRWIFCELGPLGTTLPDYHPLREFPESRSARGVQWHTAREMRKVLRSIGHVPGALDEKASWTWLHLDLFSRNLTNIGRGMDLMRPLLEPDIVAGERAAIWGGVCERFAGYEPSELKEGRLYSPEMFEFAQDPTRNEKLIERLIAQNKMELDVEDVEQELPLEQQRRAAELGVEIIYFTSPGREGSPEQIRLHDAGVLPRFLHFNDPERYPRLFKLGYRYDPGHLNRYGVELFSQIFAAEVLERGWLSGPKAD